MRKVTAVLIDTVSIQKYVYSSNRLKENIGASSIVTNIYKDSLERSVKTALNSNKDINLHKWRENPNDILILNSDTNFEVGYIGGANALLFFADHGTAEKFVREWTKNLLIESPGLNVAFAILDFDLNDFQNRRNELYKHLEINKSIYHPQTFLPKHSITADCPLSGLSADVFKHKYDGERDGYISSSSYAKYENAKTDDAKNLVELRSKGRFTCTTEINKLGQTPGNNHIAIIHIDGNSLGEQFKACENLVQTRKLSKNLDEIMIQVYTEFLDFIIGEMDFFMTKESGFGIKKDNTGKYIIPFRPILIEGDDITFITDGRLGIPFAEKYLELMTKKTLLNGKKLSACAGVAIVKTKYPFFRSYSLAEELCQNGKIAARKNEDTSWLDFHVSYGGFSGTIEQIRKTKYTAQDGRLQFGPYLTASKDIDNEKNIYHLKKGIKTFIDRKKWPRSKVKEFREILTLGEDATRQFITEAKLKDVQLYDFHGTGKENYSTFGWMFNTTPYFDMIELLDVFPERYLDIWVGE